MALDWGIDELEIYGDSFLVISQAKGDWEVRDERLALYHNYLKELIKMFKCIFFNYLPREDNHFLDALAYLGSVMCLPPNIAVEPIDLSWDRQPAYVSSILAITIEDDEFDGKLWFYDIKNFLEHQAFLEGADSKVKGTITRLAGYFVIVGGILY
ncbi:PREDICTED: uncharacterized protein LOC109115879 [Nelumbo nucifera]|uniref:Uncharacterized protein LOC109115879 n=1 Tax=Nelumbo nucifera TaxID=4432 RepID=A0A1U8QCG5_NELNU|nr:PREDICTED: uncharacterized protein LOC109115879 [Nelumbo nucifera]